MHVGVDIGGTFTDVVCAERGTGLRAMKVPSTPDDPSRAVLDGLDRMHREWGLEPGRLVTFAHGTTVATNAVLERKGARVGLIATEGFRDVLEIGRQLRRQMYAVRLEVETPVFLAPGRRRKEVRERIGPGGEVLVPLDEETVVRAVDALVSDGVDAIAVCLLFSFVNEVHERRIGELIQARHPHLRVSLSSDVDPAAREYERTAVTAFDAYIKPIVDHYLHDLNCALEERGVAAPLQVMQSRGGLSNAAVSRNRPVRLFLSGPAAGVMGACAVGAQVGVGDLISLDVGGTSSDIALVSQAKPLIRAEGVIDGFPVRVPMIDVNAIGAGGGSIAWLDAAGGLRVGPRSAGAEPGPACYGRGGREPTVTDASVVLGYLNPDYFGGGQVTLVPARAEDSIRSRIAEPLGLSVAEAAAGIHRVVNAQMAEGIRLVSIRQGFDPRDFTLVALGGAGPLHACALAEDLGIRRIVVPRHPGALSAAGLLSAPIEHEVATAMPTALESLTLTDVDIALGEIDARCERLMAAEGEAETESRISYSADVCYIGQGYHLEVPFHRDDADPIGRLRADFLTTHDRVHGHAVDAPARLVNLRTVHRRATGATTVFASTTSLLSNYDQGGDDGRDGRGDEGHRRPVRFADVETALEAAIIHRDELDRDVGVDGPAVIEQDDTTTLVPPSWRARVANGGVLFLEPATEG